MRITIPTRQLHVAAAIIRLTPEFDDLAEDGIEISDEHVQDLTGYSLRSVQLALQEMESNSAITCGRAVDGVRLVTPVLTHPIWAFARTMLEVA